MTNYEIENRIVAPFIWVDAKIENMKIDPYSYRLYMRFIFRARNSSNGCFESQEHIADAIGISKRKIIYSIQNLTSLNMIEIQKRRNGGGHFSSNLIVLKDPSEWTVSPSAPHASGQVHHMHPAIGTTCTRLGGVKPQKKPTLINKTHECEKRLTRSSSLTRSSIELLNADEKQPAAKTVQKKTGFKAKKMKPWSEKTEDEKKDAILNLVVDSHRLALAQNRFTRPYPFDNICDAISPTLKFHGLEKTKEFLDHLLSTEKGCDVRKFSAEIKNFVKNGKEGGKERVIEDSIEDLGERLMCGEDESKLGKIESQFETNEKSFPEKIITQIEVNNMNFENSKNVEKNFKVEDFPIRFQIFYNEKLTKKHKHQIQKEILTLGFEKFFQHRATAILKCSYEELFEERGTNVGLTPNF